MTATRGTQRTIEGKVAVEPKRGRRDSEFQSYTYIKNELKDRGWNTRNPNRDADGQLYTQIECHGNPELKSMLGQLTPEYIVKLREDAFWVIEAKPTVGEIETAYKEATEDYGALINKHSFVRAKIASGVAGNDIDRYVVKTGFWDESKKKFIPVVYDEREITSLLKPETARKLLDQNSPVLETYEIDTERFVNTAIYINEILHSASIKKDKRATIMATILLSMLGDTDPNCDEEDPDQFVDDINSRAKNVLDHFGKGQFFQYIEIDLPEKRDAKLKWKQAFVSTIFQLKKIDIKAAMKAGSDILGTFYETFLKYGNGAKDLGILLTPRQITQFAAEVLEIGHSDILYDPTAGTGGFLVSGFYLVKEHASEDQVNDFKRYGIFGIEQEPSIAALAVVNMIFRGDGRDNIVNDDCLKRSLIESTADGHHTARFVSRTNGLSKKKAVTKVLMNPPFGKEKKTEESTDEKEYKFVDHALEQMEDGGLLFSIFPLSGMVKQADYSEWRGQLLEKHTLLSVMSLPHDLFYPSTTGQITVALIVRKGVPHPPSQNVLWLRVMTDGFVKVKGKRLPDPHAPNELEKVKNIVRAFIHSPGMKVESSPGFQKATPIDAHDTLKEYVPEAYLDSRNPSIEAIEGAIDALIRETVGFLIIRGFERGIPFKAAEVKELGTAPERFGFVDVTEIFNIESGDFHSTEKELDEGKLPLVSCGELENGLVGLFAAPEKSLIHKNAFTVAYNGQPLNTNFHPYEFLAKDDVAVCTLKAGVSLETAIVTAAILNIEKWRYSYARKCFKEKFTGTKIPMPVDGSGNLDVQLMKRLVQRNPYWKYLSTHIEEVSGS
jgi:type I restriction-modification system DNA methylase subunit